MREGSAPAEPVFASRTARREPRPPGFDHLKESAVSRATTATSAQTIEQFDRFVIPNYKRYPICLVRGEGSYVWDAEGNRYLDLFPGWGCNILGHSPPAGRAGHPGPGRRADSRAQHLVHRGPGPVRGAALCERGFGGRPFSATVGAEAIEAAIKLARLTRRGTLQDHHVRKMAFTAARSGAGRHRAAQVSRGARPAGRRLPLCAAQRPRRGAAT